MNVETPQLPASLLCPECYPVEVEMLPSDTLYAYRCVECGWLVGIYELLNPESSGCLNRSEAEAFRAMVDRIVGSILGEIGPK